MKKQENACKALEGELTTRRIALEKDEKKVEKDRSSISTATRAHARKLEQINEIWAS